jgi:putative membrane-bound dehydrogenase-like protein
MAVILSLEFAAMTRRFWGQALLVLSTLLLSQSTLLAQAGKKVLFLAGKPSHGYGAHEHHAGCLILAKSIEQGMPGYKCEIQRNEWPKDEKIFDGVDTIVMYCDGGGGHLVMPKLAECDALAKKGIGIVCIHYGVEVPKGEAGVKFMEWIGGYFEPHWSVNPHWNAKFEKFPDHPISRGVAPFESDDEWYYHMRFREGMKDITPILTAVPPASTLSRPDGPHSGNPDVRKTIGQPQHVAWACEREDGGRGFGFTGGHNHWNWGDPNFRKIVLNAIVWTAKGEVPEKGVGDSPVTMEDLEANQDYPKPKDFNLEETKKHFKLKSKSDAPAGEKKTSIRAPVNASTQFVSAPLQQKERDANDAVKNLDVGSGLEATLFAAEPMLLSPANMEIDHLGRVWVSEVVNYRRFANRERKDREEGDRILVLEDTDKDGKADKSTVFYQGRDIDSAHGLCVLGNRVIVSALDSVFSLYDDNGDLKADRKELMFTGIDGAQHDHGIHAFVFGPDGKLYFNFGNAGRHLKDKNGKPVIDKAGNEINDSRRPYQEGMVFRCDLDGSNVETLGWNFRNNWEVCVDAFGTLWQSDNDDDGNRGVRINFVMEFGNYGFKDEKTGASWPAPRTNLEQEIPLRHWHLNDPGVVPNLLQTGGGSPTGIMVYEGSLLPEVFRNQIIHCDAGPSIVRAYPAKKQGAGYVAEMVTILEGTRDNWFRPSDVTVAPDGSIFVADWYDPGVGGHRQGDLDRGRVFRVAPPGSKYSVPTFDFNSTDGAIAALANPALSVRYLGWMKLFNDGEKSIPALEKLVTDSKDERLKARGLWLLGKIAAAKSPKGMKYVELAIKDQSPDIRILGLRLARQLGLDGEVLPNLAKDDAPEVRRECAIALRHSKLPNKVDLWATLASRHDGKDRWYLEALGIGADGNWDACLAAWLKVTGDKWNTPGGRDIIWRSRAKATPVLLAKLIESAGAGENVARYFRAMDFLPEADVQPIVAALAIAEPPGDETQKTLIAAESLQRLKDISALKRGNQSSIVSLLDRMRGTLYFVRMIGQLDMKERYPELINLAANDPDGQLAFDAMRVMLEKDQTAMLGGELAGNGARAAALAKALASTGDPRTIPLFLPLVEDATKDAELRRQATRGLARSKAGAVELIKLTKLGKLDESLKSSAAFGLQSAQWDDLRDEIAKLFPAPPAKGEAMRPIRELVKQSGDANRGRDVFQKSGECAKCHIVNNEGKEVGPNLSEIGRKLSKQALFESILYPSAGISHNYETYTLALESGQVVSGLLVSKTDDAVSIKTQEAIVQTYKPAEIESMKRQPISLMPADLQKNLTVRDIVDVVEYLQTLKAPR